MGFPNDPPQPAPQSRRNRESKLSRPMQRILYSFVLTLAVPMILVRLFVRSIKAPRYRQRIGERFSRFALPATFDRSQQTIWIHAVSVGEATAAVPLVRAIKQRHPSAQIYITTMTPTGSERVLELFGDKVFHSYMPYDLPLAIDAFIRRIDPRLLILMETELWPNTIHHCHRRGVKLLLANARLSERSARGYRRISGLTRTMLSKIDYIAAQSQADADRLVALGAESKSVEVCGSLKFIITLDEADAMIDPVFASIKESGRTVLIAASTRSGEEEKVLRAFKKCLEVEPTLLLLLVPRHPERFDNVARLCQDEGLQLGRRSAQQALQQSMQVYLGDSMGEMLSYYRAADIAFVGGSLVDTGCQNVLEPAALSLPIVVGPSQYNFATICAQLEQAGALRTVVDENELAQFVIELLADKTQQIQMGLKARELLDANQGALAAVMQLIEGLLPE